MRTDPSKEAAYEANKKLQQERTLYKTTQPIVSSLREINNSLDELKDLMKDVIGIIKYMDLNAYGQHSLQKMYETSQHEQQI